MPRVPVTNIFILFHAMGSTALLLPAGMLPGISHIAFGVAAVGNDQAGFHKIFSKQLNGFYL